jgi:hypothetical protein
MPDPIFLDPDRIRILAISGSGSGSGPDPDPSPDQYKLLNWKFENKIAMIVLFSIQY